MLLNVLMMLMGLSFILWGIIDWISARRENRRWDELFQELQRLQRRRPS